MYNNTTKLIQRGNNVVTFVTIMLEFVTFIDMHFTNRTYHQEQVPSDIVHKNL